MPGTIDLCLKQQHSPSEIHMDKNTRHYRETVTRALKHLGHPYGNPPTKVVVDRLKPFLIGKLPKTKSEQREALIAAALVALHAAPVEKIAQAAPPKKIVRKSTEPADKDFYASWAWKEARYAALKRHGRRCGCCGWTPDSGGQNHLVVDHVKPIRTHPNLALEPSNHQVLCNDCNMGKSYKHTDDFRK